MLPISDAGRPHGSVPFVNFTLLGLNTLVFLYEIGVGGFGFLFGGDTLGILVFFLKFGFIPAELSSGQAYQILPGGIDIASPYPYLGNPADVYVHPRRADALRRQYAVPVGIRRQH